MSRTKLTSKFQQALAMPSRSRSAATTRSSSRPTCCWRCSTSRAARSGRCSTKAGGNVAKLRTELCAGARPLPKVEGAPGDIHVSNDLGGC
jgi:ATP-dependent Clp protease ATP-binding subunit ClpB